MRSFLSRFTLSSVAALALAGLIAGCSGGTSSSLPGGTGATGGATGGNLTAQMMLAKLQQQIASKNFPKANVGAIKVHHMTQSEVAGLAKALGVVRGGQVHQGSNAVDIPGGFGFSTTTSPPGPYSGIFGQLAAYCVGPAQVGSGCNPAVGPPFFSFVIPPGPPPSAYSTSTDVLEAMVAPGGGCIIPMIEYQTVETYSGGVFTQYPTNWFDWLNLCSFTGNAFPLDQAFFSSNYINPSPGAGEPPTLNVETFCTTGPGCPAPGSWSLGVFNESTHAFDDFTFFDNGCNITGPGCPGAQNNFLGGGFAGYVERAMAIGPCQALPNGTGGLGIQNIQIYDSGAGIFRPLAPTMPGNTFTAFNNPNTSSQTCFTNDGTHIGQQYQVNGSGGQPFYTGGGGQMLITSFPSP
ncbi:MAG: hypothetical protein JO024_06145 [Candidatus Eremiobacteraeota bacterium]|nr:hypothetical protein [Candidatus Eremiobacteraeota bacterium]